MLFNVFYEFLKVLFEFKCQFYFETFGKSLFILFAPSFCLHLYETHPAFTCSKLTIETIEQGMKYVQSYH